MDLILTSVGISGKSLREAVNCNTFVLTSSEEKVYAITFLNEEAGQCNIAGPSFGSGTRAFITDYKMDAPLLAKAESATRRPSPQERLLPNHVAT